MNFIKKMIKTNPSGTNHLNWFKPLKLDGQKENFITVLILDESGSMEIIKKEAVDLMKNTIKASVDAEIKNPNQNHYCAVVSFEGTNFTPLIPMIKPMEIGNHLYDQYNPSGNTPLYDAIGLTIQEVDKALTDNEHYKLAVYIITDGEENASTKYTETEIYNLIETYKSKGWEFNFLGANIPVEEIAERMNIDKHYSFKFSDEGVKELSNMVFKMQEEKFSRNKEVN